MATVRSNPAPTDDTVEIDPEEDTLSGGEWPVPEEYRVEPDTAGGGHTVVPRGTQSRRRLPPGVPHWLAAVLLAGLLLIPAAVVLASHASDDDDPDAARADGAPLTTTAPASVGADSTAEADVASVPDVTGARLAEARATLEDAGFRVRARMTESSRASGEVLVQAPTASSSARKGQLVVLTVSGGAARDTVSVPDVVGLTAGKASGVLRRANLEPTIRLTRSDAAGGTVLSQVPAGGREIDEGGRVRLVVATGPSQRVALTVPDLRGLDVETARRRLGELGLRTTVTRVAAADEEGTILGQSPRAGATLREGQVVGLRVSSGPALVMVPDVVGLDELTSTERLQAAGFQVEVIDQATAEPNEDGIVLSQEPAGSFRAERGAVVTVTVGRLG